MRLPVIVSMGGVNAAGRTSGFQSFRRMIIETLSAEERQSTIAGLAVMMGLTKTDDGETYRCEDGSELDQAGVAARFEDDVLSGTLVRRVEQSHFDVDALYWQSNATLQSDGGGNEAPLEFVVAKDKLPKPLPESWSVDAHDDDHVRVTATGGLDIKFNNTREFPIKAAGQLPTGFEMASLYNSRFQPRGLHSPLSDAQIQIEPSQVRRSQPRGVDMG